jgi:molybdopterin/thiamine biosynthesis adenylyltransferase
VKNKALKVKWPKSVKVIGLGGVGGIVARYSALFLAASGQPTLMYLIDGDKFEPTNASRMFFGACGNKARVVTKELLPRLKHSRLGVLAVREYIRPDNIKGLIREGDIVLLCVDNHATRKLVSDHCRTLKRVTLISGGNDGIEKGRRGTYGNVHVGDLTKFHPEIANPKDKMPHELSCTDLVISTPQILYANLAVASAICNTLLLHLSNKLHYSELCFDIADGLMRPTLKMKGQ